MAAALHAELRALSRRNTPNERTVRRNYSRLLKQADPEFVFAVAQALLQDYDLRSTADELIESHRAPCARS